MSRRFTLLALLQLAAILAAASPKAVVSLGWGESGRHYPASEKPAFERNAFAYKAWKGERINAMALLWSESSLEDLAVSVSEVRAASKSDYVIPGDAVEPSFVSYIIGDELAPKYNQCDKRDTVNWKAIREADFLSGTTLARLDAGLVQPVWLSIDVPSDAADGRYSGLLRLSWKGGGSTLPFSFTVGKRCLKAESGSSFHLDLWQNPYAVARVAGVRLWSKEHFEAMTPIFRHLVRVGQKVVTTTIINRPWNGQTEDPFGSMVTKIRRADGSWLYDYTVFDMWVEYMASLGIDSQINCYSMIPWKLEFDYFDQATGQSCTVNAAPGSEGYEAYWGRFIVDFAAHLRQKGWFEKTYIAMDERPEESMAAALALIKKYEPEMKVALAGNYHASIADDIDDLCITFSSVFPEGDIERRRAEGKISTYYTCCAEGFPNTFIASQPEEACWNAMVALQKGVDGYLRWAVNSWTAEPEKDARFRRWAAGDTYMLYPDGRSSVRFEKFAEGMRDYRKTCQLMEEWSADPRRSADLAALQAAVDSFTFAEIEANGPFPALKKLRRMLEKQ